MKTSRNDPCPCGSGKKFKRCCMDSASKQSAEIFEDISQITAMNPNLTLDELNIVLQKKTADMNNRPNPDFCGLTPTQMANWMYAPFPELIDIAINTPPDLSTSPVMRYLGLILDALVAEDGSLKATTKGNLPAKLVQRASSLLPGFAVAQYSRHISISEFAGSNEDKFNALHYTRILAQLAGLIYLKAGRFHFKKTELKRYQKQGLAAFFPDMLEAATRQFNWAYFDGYTEELQLEPFWVFMLWRLQTHGSLERMNEEVCIAFPDLLKQLPSDGYFSPERQLGMMISVRFVERFLGFFGFVLKDPALFSEGKEVTPKLTLLPLLGQTFKFSV